MTREFSRLREQLDSAATEELVLQWTKNEPPAMTREIVFIDADVKDADQLVSDLARQNGHGQFIDIIVLGEDRDGLEQIHKALTDREDFDAMHIVSCGPDGAIKLGSAWLRADNVSAYAAQITDWGDALVPGGDLLIYGCDLAGVTEGQDLLETLHILTGVDVAASADAAGAASLSGDLDLEFRRGDSQTHVSTKT